MEPYFEIDKELVDALILEIHLEFVRKRGDVTRVIWSRKQEFYGFKLGEFSLMQSNLREALIFWWLIRDLENMSVHKAYAKFLFLHKYVYSISRNKYMVISLHAAINITTVADESLSEHLATISYLKIISGIPAAILSVLTTVLYLLITAVFSKKQPVTN